MKRKKKEKRFLTGMSVSVCPSVLNSKKRLGCPNFVPIGIRRGTASFSLGSWGGELVILKCYKNFKDLADCEHPLFLQVGGTFSDTVLTKHMKRYSRVVVIGIISSYNATSPPQGM